jgi:hypothetical protein
MAKRLKGIGLTFAPIAIFLYGMALPKLPVSLCNRVNSFL